MLHCNKALQLPVGLTGNSRVMPQEFARLHCQIIVLQNPEGAQNRLGIQNSRQNSLRRELTVESSDPTGVHTSIHISDRPGLLRPRPEVAQFGGHFPDTTTGKRLCSEFRIDGFVETFVTASLREVVVRAAKAEIAVVQTPQAGSLNPPQVQPIRVIRPFPP